MAYYEYCPEHNGIEIYFDDRPDEEYLTCLRENGWHWHRTKKCWYSFYSDENEELPCKNPHLVCSRVDCAFYYNLQVRHGKGI